MEQAESPDGYYAANKSTGVDLSSILQNPNESGQPTEMKGSVLRSKSEMRSEEPTLIIANVMPTSNERGESHLMARNRVNSRNHPRIQGKHRKTSATIGNQMQGKSHEVSTQMQVSQQDAQKSRSPSPTNFSGMKLYNQISNMMEVV